MYNESTVQEAHFRRLKNPQCGFATVPTEFNYLLCEIVQSAPFRV